MSFKSKSSLKPLLMRTIFGLFFPIFIEIFVYIVYTGLRTGNYQYSILSLFVFFIIPTLFLYLIAPKTIFFLGGVRHHIRKNILSNLDNIFLKPRKYLLQDKAVPLLDMELKLTDEEYRLIKLKIKNKLIPNLLKESENLYGEQFIDRNHTSTNERLLTYHETLFLFSGVSSLVLLLNLVLIIILNKTSIILDFIELDQITNSTNIVVFALIFGVLLVIALYLFIVSSRKICNLIPQILPIIYYEPEEEREKRLSQILAIAEFPISNLFVRRTQRELARSIEAAKRELLQSKLVSAISWYYRDEMAKTIAWKLYKEVLEEIQIPEETKTKIEKQFLFDPLARMFSSQILTLSEEKAIKADIDYIQEKLVKWSKIRSEEQTLSFLLIYRTLETIFRKIAANMSDTPLGDEINFLRLIDILEKNSFFSSEEVSLLHEIRFKRNLLFHEPGKSLDIGKQTMDHLLKLLSSVINRINE